MRYFYLFLVLLLCIYSAKARHIREDFKNKQVASGIVCPEELYKGILWPASPSGPYQKTCPGNYTSEENGKTTRICSADGTWSDNFPPCYPRIADSFELDTSRTTAESANENGFTIYKYIKISFKGDCQGLSSDTLKVILKYNYTNSYNYTFKIFTFQCGSPISTYVRDYDEKDRDIKSNKMDIYLEIENSDIEITRTQVIFGCLPISDDFNSFPSYILKDNIANGICVNDTISKSKPNRKCKIDGNWDENIVNPCYYSIDTNILKFNEEKINRYVDVDNKELCFKGSVIYNYLFDCGDSQENENEKSFNLSLYYHTKATSENQFQIDKEIIFKCQKTIEFKIDQSQCFPPSNNNNIIFFILKSDNKVIIQNITYVLGCDEIKNDKNDNWDVSIVGENVEGYCTNDNDYIANSVSGKPIRECSTEDGEWKMPKYRCISRDYKDIKLEIKDNSVSIENNLFYLNNVILKNEKVDSCISVSGGNKFSLYYTFKNDKNREEEILFNEISYNCENTLLIQPKANNRISFDPLKVQIISMTMKLSSSNDIINYISIPLGCSSQFDISNSNFNSSSLYNHHEIVGECVEGSSTLSLSNPHPKAVCKLNNKLEIINPCYSDINHIKINTNNIKPSLKINNNNYNNYNNNNQFCLNGKVDLVYESSCSELQPPSNPSTMLKLYYYYEDESQLNLVTETEYKCKEGVIYSYVFNEVCLSEVKYSKLNFYLVHSDGIEITSSSIILGCPMTNINKYILPVSSPTIINNNDSTIITYVDGNCIDGYNYTIKPTAACNEYGEWENSTGLCYYPSYKDIEFDLSHLKITNVNNQLTVSGFIKLNQNSTCDDQPIELPLELFIRIEETEMSIYKFNYICKSNSEVGSKVLENKITQTTDKRMATLILKYNNINVNELNIYVPCPSISTTTSTYPETNAGEVSVGICNGEYTSKTRPTRLCKIDGTWSDNNINDNCKIESFISKWGGLIFGLLGAALFLLLLSCFLVYWFHRKHISHWKSQVEEMDNKWREHNDGEIQKVEFNATSNTKKVVSKNNTNYSQQQPNLFIPDNTHNINNDNSSVNINANTLFPKNTWLKQQAEVGYDDDDDDDDEYYEDDDGEEGEYEEGEEEEGERYYEEEEEVKGNYDETVNNNNNNNSRPSRTHNKKKRIINTLEKIDEEEDEGDDEFDY